MKFNYTINRKACLTALVFCLIMVACKEKPAPFSIGADISFVPQMEARDVNYKNANDVEEEVCKILAKNHFDIIRLRIFVDPAAPNGYSKEGFCDLEHTLSMAKRIKAAGMNFALDFHYSDYWADPDKQYKPAAWQGLTGTALENKLYEYTKEVLTRLKQENVAPVIVQVGNEISHGMVWPEGKILDTATEDNWAALMGLYKAGQKAVREVLPDTKLMVHLALGGENTLCREFLDKMNKYGAEFDLVGLSYYERWHETYNDLQANLYDLARRYHKPVLVCEYDAGIENTKRINDIVRSVPDNLGYGTMAWEPLRTLFDKNGKADKDLFAVYNSIYNEYNDPQQQPVIAPPFTREVAIERPIIGADISWVQSQEDKGLQFSDKGEQKDVLQILTEHDFNWIRLRLFVDPTTENGYSSEGYCDLEHTLSMAKRIKAAGMKFLLDFHYSDNWADPGKQFTPKSWEDKTGSALEAQVYNYTVEVIKKFKEEGITPDMVQIGNEINHGMLWPQGALKDGESAESFCVLLRCASAAVRATDPDITIMVHIAEGGNNQNSVWFLDKILSRDVKFDVIGESYYPEWHGTPEDLKNNLTSLATRYKKPIIVVEYQDYKKEVNEIVKGLPDHLGLGTFIWEATSPRWGNLFDKDGATNENIDIYPAFFENYKQ